MDILLQTPTICAPRQLTGTETIEELKAIKAEWLHAAQEAGHLQACAIVAETLGTRFTRRGWESMAAWRWELNGVRVELYRGSGNYLPERQAFAQITALVVYAPADHMVLYYRESTDLSDNRPDKNYIAPGEWLDVVLSVAPRAQEIHDAQLAGRRENDRLALLDLLTNGRAI